MIYGGSWMPPDFLGETTASFNKLYGVAQTPAWTTGAKHWCANQAGAGLSVSAKSSNVDIALEFLKFLYEPARYSATMNASNSMPSTKAAVALVKNPKIRTMTSWLLREMGAPISSLGSARRPPRAPPPLTCLRGSWRPRRPRPRSKPRSSKLAGSSSENFQRLELFHRRAGRKRRPRRWRWGCQAKGYQEHGNASLRASLPHPCLHAPLVPTPQLLPP